MKERYVPGKSGSPGGDRPGRAVSDIVPVRRGPHGRGQGSVIAYALLSDTNQLCQLNLPQVAMTS
jgi:hypothetical protein